MQSLKDSIRADFYRNIGKQISLSKIYIYLYTPSLRFLLYYRILNERKLKFLHPFFNLLRIAITRKSGIEITGATKIGRGLRLVHPYNITINPRAELGDNVNIFKGATIGFALGKKNGVPKIGSRVQIGANATIVGDIQIGDDVLVAPNAFVNICVPSHSVVIGNPAVIYHKDNCTDGYIGFLV